MIVAGVGALAWAFTVWKWEDPFTATLNYYDQRQLAESFDRQLRGREAASARHAVRGRRAHARSRAARSSGARASKRGDAVARLRIPRLGLNEIIVNGTDHDTLKRGPGRYLGSAMPGEGELVYVAGHRTTYGAPFSRIDKLRKGDRVFVELPYGTIEYAITGPPDRRRDRDVGAEVEGLRAARAPGLPPALLRHRTATSPTRSRSPCRRRATSRLRSKRPGST